MPGQTIITLSHLFKRVGTVPLRDSLARLNSDKKRIQFLAEATAEITGLKELPQYLTLLFEVDALFLNMDIAPKALIAAQRARPFNTTFNRQIITARNLYDYQLRMPMLTRDDICEELRSPLTYYAERDRGIIMDRVCETILSRQKD